MSANDTGWISTAPQGQPGMPPAPQAAPPAQGQPAQKLSADDTGWLPTTPQPAIQAPVKPQSTEEVDRIMGPQTVAGQLFERQQKLGPSPETVGAVKEIGRNTLDALKGAVQSFNPKPQDVSEAEALKTAGIGGMLIYRMAASLGHPLLDANKVAAAIHEINQSKDPMGTYLEFARETASQGAGQGILALATEGMGKGVPAAVKGIGKQLPVGMDTAVTSQGAEIPVRGKTFGAKVAGQLVSPEVPERIAQEKTAPAVQKAVGDVLGKATGSKAETILSPETGDSFGVRGHATSLIGEATPVMDRIDELSGNKLSDAQAEAKAAKAKNDWEGVTAARAKQQSLFDQYRGQLSNENLDVDTAVGKYRKAMRLDEIAPAFERAIDKDTGDLSGKKLSNEIGKMVAKGPKKSPLLSRDFTQDHISALREVADIMKGQETIPTPIIYSTLRAAAAFLGVERSGFSGLAENVIGERLLEAGGRRLANRIWADALAEPAATPKLAAGLKNGDIQPVVAELAKEDPSWRDKISQRLSELWHSTTGEAGLPGTVNPNIEEPEKPFTLHHWSNEDLTETNPEKFGTGKAGAERAREKEPGFLKRTYFADEGYKEPAIQGQKYHYTTQVDPTKFYDIAKDPEGIWQKGLREGGPTEAEKAVHDAGYTGYQHDGGYVSFEKHAVTKVSPKVAPDEHGFAPAEHSEYAAAIKANPQSATLTQPEEMTNNRVFSNGKGTFYSITPDGDIQGLVNNNPKDIGAVIKAERSAIANGGKTLDAWDLYLPKIYAKLGFENTELVPYDEKTYGPPSDELKEAWKKQGWKEDQPYPGVQHMKVTDEALRKFGPKAAEPVQANASGESAASLEAQSRLKTQQAQGLRMFDVDSRMAGSKEGWHPIMSTVDAVDKTAQPFHYIVSIDKDGKVDVINSGEGAKPLPADEHIRQLTKQAVGETPKTFARPVDLSDSEIGTRYPTAANAVISNDPSATTGLEALNEADRQAPSRTTQAGKPVLGIKQKLVAALADYKDNGISHLLDASDPDAAIEKYIEHVKGNLKWLHNAMPEAIRGVARHWYESAHDLTKEIADKNNVTHEQSAAVTAALSPKNDWNNNVGQAKRLIERYANDQQHAWTPQMDKTLSEIRNGGAISAPLQRVMDTVRGKTYDQLTAKTPEALLAKKAIWFRVLDEAHGAKDTPIYGPDGTVRGSQTLKWGQVDPIAKALAILEDGSLENINSVMGEGHKIRNFYNNIVNPWSKRGHTTIDTHAVGAALTKPFSQEDLEVAHNFGSGNKAGTPSPAKHAATGLRGSYAVHEEAYKRAAAELGLQPRELQSITWEGIRSLMGESKKTPELRRAVSEVWRAHEAGELTLPEAREKILEQAGGFAKPAWLSDEEWEKSAGSEGAGDTSFGGGE